MDLLAIGEACADAPLITGGSGIALGLPRDFHRAGLADTGHRTFRPATGREGILAGNCSQATLAQIAEHEKRHPVLKLPVGEIVEGTLTASDVVAFIEEHEGRAPLVTTSQPPDQVKALQARYGTEVVAGAIDRLFSQAAAALVSRGLRRLVVAGGETSGAVASALGVESFDIGPEIAPGVPAVSITGGNVALALKSGNFGQVDFFARALATLEGSS